MFGLEVIGWAVLVCLCLGGFGLTYLAGVLVSDFGPKGEFIFMLTVGLLVVWASAYFAFTYCPFSVTLNLPLQH